MSTPRWFAAILVIAFLASGVTASAQKVLYGAIRWDAWTNRKVTPYWTLNPSTFTSITPYENNMPFYSRIISASNPRLISLDGTQQETMDREIDFARDAKLDYWVFFNNIDPVATPSADFFLEAFSLYLSSSKNADIKFCLAFYRAAEVPALEWSTYVPQLVSYMRMDNYQTTPSGRPVFFIFRDPATTFGAANVSSRLAELRREAAKYDLDPYIVQMGQGPVSTLNSWKSAYGMDAISDYAQGDIGDTYTGANGIAAANQAFRSAAVGSKVIPLVNVGWGGPRHVPASLSEANMNIGQPTRSDFAAQLNDSRNWVVAHPTDAEANMVVMYAWNEYDEGGRLGATLGGAPYLAELRDFMENDNLPSGGSPAVESTPRAPTNLVAVPLTSTKVRLIWSDNSQVETYYKVERKTGGGSYAPLTTTLAANSTVYDDTTVTAANQYTYRVRAFTSPSSDSAFSNEVTATPLGGGAATEVLLDNVDPQVILGRFMQPSSSVSGYIGSNYAYSDTTGATAPNDPAPRATEWSFDNRIKLPGTYEVQARWTSAANRKTAALYSIATSKSGSPSTTTKDQQDGAFSGQWVTLGTYSFTDTARVTLDYALSSGTGYTVIADAMRLVPPGSGGMDVLMADDFADGNDSASPAWTRVSGGSDWSVANQIYSQANTSSAVAAQLAVSAAANAASWGNYTVEADVVIPAADSGHTSTWAVGFVARYQNSSNFYTLRIRPNMLEIGKFVGGTFTSLGTASGTFSLNTLYSLRLVLASTTLTGTVRDAGGTLLTTVTITGETSFSTGTAGLRTAWASALYDDVLVVTP